MYRVSQAWWNGVVDHDRPCGACWQRLLVLSIQTGCCHPANASILPHATSTRQAASDESAPSQMRQCDQPFDFPTNQRLWSQRFGVVGALWCGTGGVVDRRALIDSASPVRIRSTTNLVGKIIPPSPGRCRPRRRRSCRSLSSGGLGRWGRS